MAISCIALGGCEKQPAAQKTNPKNPIQVMVSILPQIEFVKKIGGDNVNVEAMIEPGFSPATYEPAPEQIKKLAKADLYIRIGYIPFEKAQMDKLKSLNPKMKILNFSKGLDLLKIKEPRYHEHEEGYEENHKKEKKMDLIDPHLWLSPKRVKRGLPAIAQALTEKRPELELFFKQNLRQYTRELDILDQELETQFSLLENRQFLVYHPAFGYLADDYGLTQIAIEEQGKEPTAAWLAHLVKQARENNIKVVFIQKQFSTQAAENLATEINGVVVPIDPLNPNYLDNMRNIGQTIHQYLNQ